MHPEGPRLRVLIVDDERPARDDLRRLASAFPQLEVVAEAGDVESAERAVRQHDPDVLFLDIEMPGASGFELLDRLRDPPRVVFVTAYDQHAVRAFEVNALDYLLKPVHAERLELTVHRLLGEAEAPVPPSARLRYEDRVFVNASGCYRFVELKEIRCIRAEDNYTRLVVAEGADFLVLKSMKDWEQRLPDEHFLRIHRSAIVNLNHVERIEQWFSNTCRVHVRGLREPLPMSQRFSARFRRRFSP